MKKKILLIGIVLAMALIGIWSIGKASKTDKVTDTAQLLDIDQLQLFSYVAPVSTEAIGAVDGIVFPTHVVPVRMLVDGTIDTENEQLTVGRPFQKNDPILKLERLDILYQLIIQRLTLKKQIQEALPQLKTELPQQYDKWAQFEKSISQTESLPIFPKWEQQAEKDFMLKTGIEKLYYEVKKDEETAEKHYYLAPFNGYILTSHTKKGTHIQKGETLLEIAQNNEKSVIATLPFSEIKAFQEQKKVNFLDSQNKEIGNGTLQDWTPILSDSLTVKVSFTIQSGNLLPQQVVKIKLADRKVTAQRPAPYIPASAVVKEEVLLFSSAKLYRKSVKIIHQKQDSVQVQGLPSSCEIVINPALFQ